MNYVEAIGYLGSVLVLIGYTMRVTKYLRLFGSAGAIAFVVYGILIQAYPVAFLNGMIVLINIYHLVRKPASS